MNAIAVADDPTTLPSGVVRLADWGVIRARGDDAASFLHGQLTSDILHLDATSVRLAGYCSPKGRLQASFVVWQGAPGEILLACSADLLAPTLKRLSMFVLRAKCRFDDASAELPLWGLAGCEALAATGAPALPWRRTTGAAGTSIALPPAVVQRAEVPRALLVGVPPSGLPALDADAWRWLEVRSGVVRVVAATAEQFVPQMVNLELVGGVDFKKGCYPGQEVVARSQYRGTLKRRAYVFASVEPLAPGDEIYDVADQAQPAGRVALAGTHAGQHAALVELKIAAFASGDLRCGSTEGAALGALAQPYALPAEAG